VGGRRVGDEGLFSTSTTALSIPAFFATLMISLRLI